MNILNNSSKFQQELSFAHSCLRLTPTYPLPTHPSFHSSRKQHISRQAGIELGFNQAETVSLEL